MTDITELKEDDLEYERIHALIDVRSGRAKLIANMSEQVLLKCIADSVNLLNEYIADADSRRLPGITLRVSVEKPVWSDCHRISIQHIIDVA